MQHTDAGPAEGAQPLLEAGPEDLRRVTFSDDHQVYETSAPASTPDTDGSGAAPSGCWGGISARVRALKREVVAVHYAVQDARVGWAARALAALALAYVLSPLDLIPDAIPILGLLDDLLIVPLLLWLAIKAIPLQVMADARRRAREEPLLLSRNWCTAVLIFFGWTALALWLVHVLVQRYGDAELVNFEWAALAGTAGVATVGFVTWSVSRVNFERRRRDEWNTLLAAPDLDESP